LSELKHGYDALVPLFRQFGDRLRIEELSRSAKQRTRKSASALVLKAKPPDTSSGLEHDAGVFSVKRRVDAGLLDERCQPRCSMVLKISPRPISPQSELGGVSIQSFKSGRALINIQ